MLWQKHSPILLFKSYSNIGVTFRNSFENAVLLVIEHRLITTCSINF